MARANCLYCGAPLDAAAVAEAAMTSERVLRTRSLRHLEASVVDEVGTAPRHYLIVETRSATTEQLVATCGISRWEAGQWQASSPYRLVRVTADQEDPLLERGRCGALVVHSIPEKSVVVRKNPIPIESIDASGESIACSIRPEPEGKPQRRLVDAEALGLVVSGPIKRERVKAAVASKRAADIRLDDNWMVHLHLRGEDRPWEIDAHRTAFEAAFNNSAHMNLLELVRRLARTTTADESFRSFVPALSPGDDPAADLRPLARGRKEGKEPRPAVLDNAAQFREYSAWRGALDAALRSPGAPSS